MIHWKKLFHQYSFVGWFSGLTYKNPTIGGLDGSGTVTEIGSQVSNFKVGDNVFFVRNMVDFGTWAQEIVINASDIAYAPKNIELEDAGAIALPLLTAYQALIALKPTKDQTILFTVLEVAGVGFQAVQLAKSMGLNVIANGNERDRIIVEKCRVLKFIDYKSQDFYEVLTSSTENDGKDEEKEKGLPDIDLVFDAVGGNTFTKSLQLKPKKIVSLSPCWFTL